MGRLAGREREREIIMRDGDREGYKEEDEEGREGVAADERTDGWKRGETKDRQETQNTKEDTTSYKNNYDGQQDKT